MIMLDVWCLVFCLMMFKKRKKKVGLELCLRINNHDYYVGLVNLLVAWLFQDLLFLISLLELFIYLLFFCFWQTNLYNLYY